MKELVRFWKANAKYSFTGWETKLYLYVIKLVEESEDGTVLATDPFLAANVGMSLNTFKDCRKRLIEAGLISYTEGGKGHGQKSQYSLSDGKKKPVEKEAKTDKSNSWIDAITVNRPWPFNVPDFDDSWRNWCFYAAKNNHKKMNQLQFDMFFKDLMRICHSNVRVASEIITHSIARGWKAPYPLKSNEQPANKNNPGDYRTTVSNKLDELLN